MTIIGPILLGIFISAGLYKFFPDMHWLLNVFLTVIFGLIIIYCVVMRYK